MYLWWLSYKNIKSINRILTGGQAMFNKKASLIITAALSTALLLSGCGEASEMVDITVAETTEKMFTDEELDEMAKNMPEIVFVMSYQIDDDNIFGCYVMKTGEIKLFDFRPIAPDEIYDVKDVYDRLEEAGCERLEPRAEMYWDDEDYDERLITEDELNTLSQDEMIGYYKRLLLIEGDAEYIKWGYTLDSYWGYYKLYGIKKNEKCVNECILLRGYGADSEYLHNNPDARDIYSDFMRLLPDLRVNASSY